MIAFKEIRTKWDLSVEDIKVRTKQILNEYKAAEDKIAAIPLNKVTIDNVLMPISKISMETNPRIEELIFLMHVSPEQELRDASTEAEKEIEAFFVTSGMRVDVF